MEHATDDRCDVESFEAIDARMRKAFRWLEQAITYLNGLEAADRAQVRPGLRLRLRFAAVRARFGRTARAPHPSAIPVLEAIDVYYEIAAVEASRDRGGAAGGSRSPRRPSMHSGCNTPAAAWRNPTGRCASASFSVPARHPGAHLVSHRLIKAGS